MERLADRPSKYSRMGQKQLIIFLAFFGLVSCINHAKDDENSSKEFYDFPAVELDISYAKGFEIVYEENYTKIVTKSIEGNSAFRDSIYMMHKEDPDLGDVKKLYSRDLNLVCQSSTYLGYLERLWEIDRVAGVCGMEYIQSSVLIEQLGDYGAIEVCAGEDLQMETLFNLNPDLFFIYPFAAEDKTQIEESGIHTLMISEYLETDPLARLEWIKVFGLLLDKSNEAFEYFESTRAQYELQLRESDVQNNEFFMNLPFGESWYAPSNSSLIVNMCRDAGLSYYFKDDGGTENVSHTQEEMWEIGGFVPYWIIIASRPADFNLDALKKEDPVYQTFKSVKEGKVIFCNTESSDYFTYGIVEPDIMLWELNEAIDGEFHDDAKYFKILK